MTVGGSCSRRLMVHSRLLTMLFDISRDVIKAKGSWHTQCITPLDLWKFTTSSKNFVASSETSTTSGTSKPPIGTFSRRLRTRGEEIRSSSSHPCLGAVKMHCTGSRSFFSSACQETPSNTGEAGGTPRKRAVLMWGNGDWGRLGLGSQRSQNEPSLCWGLLQEDPVQLACGGSHTLMLTASGNVYAMGLNDNGQLGVGNPSKQFSSDPVLITGPDSGLSGQVKRIAAGSLHSACVDSSGSLWVWGSNASTQLGLGSSARSVNCPTTLGVLAGVRVQDVALGAEHSLACTDDGLLLSWGRGPLGHGNPPLFARLAGRTTEPVPRLVRSLQEDGAQIQKVAAGMLHSACIDSLGSLHVFGGNRLSQLGLGDEQNRDVPVRHELGARVESVACGGYHTLAVTNRGDVFSWGANEGGCLGLGRGSVNFSVTPSLVEGNLKLQFASQVACGWKHSAAVADGKVFTWGWGGSMGSYAEESSSSGGQLGLGNEFDYYEPHQLSLHAAAYSLAFANLVGATNGSTSSFEPKESDVGKVFSSFQVEQVSCGFNHTGAIVSFTPP